MKLNKSNNKRGIHIGNIGNQNNLEVRKKISNSKKGKNIGKDNVMNRPEVRLKHKKILSSPYIRRKISMKCRGHIPTEEHRRKNSETKKGKNNPNYGKPQSESSNEKRRITTLKNIKKLGGVKIGKNEKRILDEIQLSLGLELARQYEVCGYSVDGYFPEANIVVEVDERGHFTIDGNLKKRDIIRQNIIMKELNCNFVRIKDT